MATTTLEQLGEREFELRVLGRTIELLGSQMYKQRNLALAELVANCWDAGALSVRVSLPLGTGYDRGTSEIVIEDDGCGMTPAEMQSAYLVLGRNRRTDVDQAMESRRPGGNRREMGRKGIGKLAGFGIAREIDIVTWADGLRTTLTLNLDELKADHNEVKDVVLTGEVEPADDEATASGTRVVLKSLKQRTPPSLSSIHATLSRRYSATARGHMVISVNGIEVVDPAIDWEAPPITDTVSLDDGEVITYLAGFSRAVLDREMQGFNIFAHEKTAQAPPFFFDVESVASGQHGTKYLHAWIAADFIDDSEDDESDVVSTDRQDLDWDDQKVEALYSWGQQKTRELLRTWADRRTTELKDRIDDDPELKARLEALDPGSQKEARRLMRSLASASGAMENWRPLADSLIRAYEFRQFHDVIGDLDAASTDPDDLESLLLHLSEWRVLESRAILEIIQGRLQIVEKFHQMIVNDAPETAPAKFVENLHDLLADYPWLLRTEWQVLDEEKSITKQLREWGYDDDPDGRDAGRYDFLGLAGDGVLKVVDIKRPGISVTLDELHRLVRYRSNLLKGAENVDAVLVSGGSYEFDPAEYGAVEFLTWSELYASVRRQYEHYVGVLKSDAEDPSFAAKQREVRTTRTVLQDGAYRGERRRDGLGEQP